MIHNILAAEVLTLVLVVLVILGITVLRRKHVEPTLHRPRGPQIVDSYAIELRERGGFSFVIVNLLTHDDQRSESYEFAPAFAYQLSNELLKASAMAAKKAEAG